MARSRPITISSLLLPVILGVDLAAQVLRDRESELAFPGIAHESHYVTQVIDAWTGEPIPGAVMALYDEEDFPTAESRKLLGRARADEDGFVRFPRRDLPRREAHWAFFTAEGYMPRGEFGYPDHPLALEPGRTRRIRFVHEDGRPAARLRLELLVGCGHTATVASWTTDDDGRVDFEAIADGEGILEFWPRGRGVRSAYIEVGEVLDPRRGGVHVVRSAPDVEGRVVDAAGRGVAGARIGYSSCHRGPWVLSDQDGSFLLTGVPAERIDIHVIPEDLRDHDRAMAPEQTFERPEPGRRVLVRLDEEGRVRRPADLLRLAVVAADEDLDLDDLAISISRAGDGFTAWAGLGSDGRLLVELPRSDDWEMVVRAEESGEVLLRRALAGEELAAGIVRLALPRPAGEMATIPVTIAALTGDWRRFRPVLVTPSGRRSLDDAFLFDRLLPPDARGIELERFSAEVTVLAAGDAAIEVSWSLDDRGASTWTSRHPIPRPPAPLDIVQPLLQVTAGGAVDPEGKPIPYAALVMPEHEPGSWEEDGVIDPEAVPEEAIDDDSTPLLVGPDRHGFFLAWTRDPGLAPLVVDLATVDPKDGRLDLGRLRFERRSPVRLQLLGPDGAPIPGAWLVIAGRDDDGPLRVEVDESGVWSPALLGAEDLRGRRIRVDAGPGDATAVFIPARTFELEGAPPWALAWPRTEVRLVLAAPEDAPLEGIEVFVAGESRHFDLGEGEPRIRGLAPGRHRIVVTATGRRARVIDFELSEKLVIPIRFGSLLPAEAAPDEER